ncbi:hypothetical protein DICVIV_13900 [Dictyocaulus viviparus]|uniref:Uncharacterized protein n=1 Tax=Dictyocaulus viviparus TaxID=29172 RepID=A0A0D8X8S2_DICVI|nr:hypothetical protein DICVIV_13900 [Dictyocaulus viviparus]
MDRTSGSHFADFTLKRSACYTVLGGGPVIISLVQPNYLNQKKRKSGVPVPGYVVLILSLAAVLSLAIMANICAAYHREKPSKSVFDKSPVPRKSNHKQSKQVEANKASNGEESRNTVKPVRTDDRNEKMFSSSKKDNSRKMSTRTSDEYALVTPNKRGSEEALDNPVTPQEFLFYLRRLSKIAIDYHNDPTTFNVTTDSSPGFLYRMMPRFAPENADSFDSICKDLRKKIFPGMTHWQHPRFYAYFLTGRRFPDMLAEVITSAMAFNIYSWVILYISFAWFCFRLAFEIVRFFTAMTSNYVNIILLVNNNYFSVNSILTQPTEGTIRQFTIGTQH